MEFAKYYWIIHKLQIIIAAWIDLPGIAIFWTPHFPRPLRKQTFVWSNWSAKSLSTVIRLHLKMSKYNTWTTKITRYCKQNPIQTQRGNQTSFLNHRCRSKSKDWLSSWMTRPKNMTDCTKSTPPLKMTWRPYKTSRLTLIARGSFWQINLLTLRSTLMETKWWESYRISLSSWAPKSWGWDNFHEIKLNRTTNWDLGSNPLSKKCNNWKPAYPKNRRHLSSTERS